MEMQTNFDVEVALKEDKTGEYKKLLIEELTTESNTIRQHLNKGVSSDEFKQLNSVLQATEAASEVVEKVWQQIHVH